MHTDKCGKTSDRNVTQKEAEKKLKYKSSCTDIQRMWKMKLLLIR